MSELGSTWFPIENREINVSCRTVKDNMIPMISGVLFLRNVWFLTVSPAFCSYESKVVEANRRSII
jgi:hypothetical protein